MLTAQLAKLMDDAHLLASARAEIDPLTSTALELELLDRFERLLDEASEHKPVADLLEEYEVGTDDMRAVIDSHPASLKDQAALRQVPRPGERRRGRFHPAVGTGGLNPGVNQCSR